MAHKMAGAAVMAGLVPNPQLKTNKQTNTPAPQQYIKTGKEVKKVASAKG